ncbi:hypothetical protein TNCV_2105631 [Trichonephila clavipes]|nr:hypothetical protein TNCV_2105631 [Trichonephila clavipes]
MVLGGAIIIMIENRFASSESLRTSDVGILPTDSVGFSSKDEKPMHCKGPEEESSWWLYKSSMVKDET